MSGKKRTSISIDEDVFRFLKQSEINQSGLINELVKEYRDNENRQLAALELRYKHAKADAEELQEKADRKFKEAEEIKELLDEAKLNQSNELDEAVDAIQDLPVHKREPDNLAVQNWADRVDMDPGELLEYVRSNT